MRYRFAALAITVMVTVSMARVTVAGGVAAPPLESLYIVRSFFSDNLSDSFTEVIDVTPVGGDVRIRVIRVSSASPFCSTKLVRAAETVITRSSIKDVVSADPCALEPEAVKNAFDAAPPRDIVALWHDASHKLVANCGGTERVFAFPYSVKVDEKKLRRSSPRVADLWDVCYRVPDRVFTRGTSMEDKRPHAQRAFEALGDKLFPELISGKYKAGLGDYSLGGYKGAPPLDKRGLLPPEVVFKDAAKYRFAKYVAPQSSNLMMTARVSGIVRLRVHADPTLGHVTNVEVIQGRPLLNEEAIRAARQWQFERGSITGEPIDLYVNFSLDCYP